MPISSSKTLLAVMLVLSFAGCSPPAGQGAVAPPSGAPEELAGLDTSALTAREKREWRTYLGELLAPCPELPVSLLECVTERRSCRACVPAARFLMHQVRAGRPQSQVYDLFEMRFDPARVRTLVIGDSPFKGPADAAVTIVEFSDFQCPGCRGIEPVLDRLFELFPDDLRLVYKHYPISYHPYAELSARAASAAQRQGKFWPMLHLCFANADQLTQHDLEGYAASLGLDLDRFRRDMESESVRRQVERERNQGEGLGIRGTPTLFINGREVPFGGLDDPLRDLQRWIELELELLGRRDGATSHGSATSPPAPPAPPPPTASPPASEPPMQPEPVAAPDAGSSTPPSDAGALP